MRTHCLTVLEHDITTRRLDKWNCAAAALRLFALVDDFEVVFGHVRLVRVAGRRTSH